MSIDRRGSGILLHPSSLPGDFGIGEIGQTALDFIDQLEAMGQQYWQLLPLNPIGPCASPYSSSSSQACNDLLVSVERLVEDGLLEDADIEELRNMPHEHVDYSWVCHVKPRVLDKAADRFIERARPAEIAAFEAFCDEHGPV